MLKQVLIRRQVVNFKFEKYFSIMSLPGYMPIKLDTDEGLRYLFISSGNKEIYKIIDYALLKGVKHDIVKTERIFNFGFADLDDNYLTVDDETSNNGDARKVLYTVLNTIPHFFGKYPDEAIAVTGSDSKKDFPEKCFKQCKKKCKIAEDCKNKNKRIKVYLAYVNLNFDTLIKEYNFFGGIDETIEVYEKNKKYKTVFVSKK